MTKQIIVCDEKHGTFHWDASTPEEWAKSSLAILTERWKAGYWYLNPDSDGLGDSEWATNERAQIAKAKAMSKEAINELPVVARKAVIRILADDRRDSSEDKQHRRWYQQAKQVVENQDLSLITISEGTKWERQEPAAWRLLEERSDYEYERVSIEPLHTGEDFT